MTFDERVVIHRVVSIQGGWGKTLDPIKLDCVTGLALCVGVWALRAHNHQPSQIEQIVDLNISDLPCGRGGFDLCQKANPRY